MPLPHQNKKESRVERRRIGGRVCAGPGSAGRRGRRGKDFSVGSAALLRAGGGHSSSGHLLLPVPAPRSPPSAPDAAPTRPSRALGQRAGEPPAPRRPARTPSLPGASRVAPRPPAPPHPTPPAPRASPSPAGAPLTSLSLASGRHPGPALRSARPLRRAAHGPGGGPRSRGRGSARVAAVAAAAGSARTGPSARTAGGHARIPPRGSAGAAGAAPARARAPGPASGGAGGRGPRSRLGRRARPRVTGPGRRAGPPVGMRSCRAKKAPDVTCSQSAHAARGQVTSASAPAPGAD